MNQPNMTITASEYKAHVFALSEAVKSVLEYVRTGNPRCLNTVMDAVYGENVFWPAYAFTLGTLYTCFAIQMAREAQLGGAVEKMTLPDEQKEWFYNASNLLVMPEYSMDTTASN